MRFSARQLAGVGAAAMALGNVGRIPLGALGGRTAPFVVADIAIAVVWLVLAVVVFGRKRPVTTDAITRPVFAFVAVAALSTVLGVARYSMGVGEALGTIAFLARWVVYFGWYLFVVWCLTVDEARSAWRYVEIAILAFVGFGIVQSAFLPGFAQLVHTKSGLPVWDEQGHRLVSTMLDPNFAGILIVIALLARLARVAEGVRERGGPLVLLVLGTALVLTISRSSAVALIAGLGVIIAARGIRFRLAYVFVVGGALIMPALVLMADYLASLNKFGIDTSAAERLIPWFRALALIAEHPVLGVGFNAMKPAAIAQGWLIIGGAGVSLDGGLLFVAAMTGLLGLACYSWMLWRVARLARQTWNDATAEPRDRAHAVAAAAATLAVVAHSFFANSLLLPFVMQILWVMWGTMTRVAVGRMAVNAVSGALRYSASRAVNNASGATGRLARNAAPLIVAAAVTLGLTSCEPCSGTSVCSSAPGVRIAGQIVEAGTGKPAAGVQVRITLGSGGEAATVTGSDGGWDLTIVPEGSYSFAATATVTAPGHTGYSIPNLNFAPRMRSSGATLVGTWTSRPHARYLATLLQDGAPLAAATVRFARTGGVAAEGTFSGSTNSVGIFALELTGDKLGDVIGTLHVSHASLGGETQLTGYVIPLDYHYGIAFSRATYSIGGLLVYGGEVSFRGTGEKVAGVSVTWTNTGGITTTPRTLTTTTNSTGLFFLNLTASARGEATGTLTFTPPSGPVSTYNGVKLATYDSTSFRYLGNFGYGERWAWAIELWRNDSLAPARGVKATFRRTGGLAIVPDSVPLVTGTDGRIVVTAAVYDTGFVDGEVVVNPPTGPARTIGGIRLRTYAADTLGFAGVFTFGPSLRYVGEIQRADGTPIVGATVTWTRTGGLAATPATVTSTTDGIGYFNMTMFPADNAEGTVIGTLTVRPPAPYAPGTTFTIPNVTLDTFLTSDLHFRGIFQIPNP
ncbi:MAG: carboxypeptidase regulatory-like domain-containing protein [Gemmatimonadetes bacterium]|nr:carboxypeptidase regulatory-like domain-containing protein [Gemmatimonadota bacterium]